MVDPWTRRDVVGQILAAGTATRFTSEREGKGTQCNALSATTPAVATANSIAAIGLFAEIDRPCLPPTCTLVWTSGHSQPGNGAACYRHDTQVDRHYVALHPRSSFIDAQGRGFRLLEQQIDVRQTGAIGDGKVDDTAACQEALDIVASAGGGVVALPAGEYRITTPLRLPSRVGLQGQGQSSLLHARSCNALLIADSDSIGPRGLSDFAVQGSECERACAILCDMGEGSRAQGLVFENLYLSFFGTGVSSRGLWHATFRTISVNQVWRGFLFRGRNVKITIDDCRITHGGLLRGTGDSIGIQVGDEALKLRPEDVQIDKTIVFGFAKAIVWRMALFGGVTNCDLDACTRTGLELVTADGGFAFRDNWVQVDGGAVRGVDCTALGYDPEMTNVAIANNRINTNQAGPGSFGIAIGARQTDIAIDGNSVSGAWETGIHANSARRLSLLNNKVSGNIALEHCAGGTVAHNFAGKGMRLNDNAGLAMGAGLGPHSGRIAGTIALPPGKTTQTATFQSLGLPDLPEGSYRVALALTNMSGQAHGGVRGHVTRTGIVAEVERPLQQQSDVSFQVETY